MPPHSPASPTRAAEFLALDLADALVGEATWACAACATRLDWICVKKLRQPLEVAVADEGVLRQMPEWHKIVSERMGK